jgi:hypothetical protein
VSNITAGNRTDLPQVGSITHSNPPPPLVGSITAGYIRLGSETLITNGPVYLIAMVVQSKTVRDARNNQTPPDLRRWVAQSFDNARIERFSPENETLRRGWSIRADSGNLGRLPDGFTFENTRVTINGKLYVQVQEQ